MKQKTSLTIRELPKTKKMEADEKTPLFKIMHAKFSQDQEQKMSEIGMIYGAAMPMMIRRQRQILSQPERFPGLRSSFLSLESHMGRLDKLEFEDVINRNNRILKLDAHDVYQVQFD